MLEEVGFVEVEIGDPVDTFAGAGGEANARAFEVYGYSFRARRPERRLVIAACDRRLIVACDRRL